MRGGKKGERRRGCDKMFSVSDTMVLVALLEMESVSEVAAEDKRGHPGHAGAPDVAKSISEAIYLIIYYEAKKIL